MGKIRCDPPFWKDYSILFQDFTLQYQPLCDHSGWNFAARVTLLSLFVGMLASVAVGLSAILVTVLFGMITAFVIVMMTPGAIALPSKYQPLPYTATVAPQPYIAPIKEHFVNGGSAMGSVQPVDQPIGWAEVDAAPYQGAVLPEHTPPTSRNLFMNVLLDEIKYNPDRPEAAAVDHPSVKQTLDDYFRIQWFSDPTDVFGKNQSQRQFVTQPSTTVPNDQGSFANWLYKIPGKTCKEGGREACLSGSDGGPIPWLNQAS
jgi:hypothetical protein